MQNHSTPEHIGPPLFEPLTEQENIQATHRIMWAITHAPQSFRGPVLLAYEAVEATNPDAEQKPGRVNIRKLELVDPTGVDFIPRVDKIHSTFGITKSDGTPIDFNRAKAAGTMRSLADDALIEILKSLKKQGAINDIRRDEVASKEVLRLLTSDPALRSSVLEDLRPDYEDVLAKTTERRSKAQQSIPAIHGSHESAPSTEPEKTDEAKMPRISRIAMALGNLLARLK